MSCVGLLSTVVDFLRLVASPSNLIKYSFSVGGNGDDDDDITNDDGVDDDNDDDEDNE